MSTAGSTVLRSLEIQSPADSSADSRLRHNHALEPTAHVKESMSALRLSARRETDNQLLATRFSIMFERFTPEVRSAIFIARQVAQATGGSEIAPEHLVIALLTVAPTCLASDQAASVLAQLGRVDYLERPPAEHAQKFMPFSTNTKNSLAAAAERAAQLGHRWVRSEHILASVLRDLTTVAAQSLLSAGVSADTLEALALARPPADTEPISAGPTMRAIVSPFRRRH